MVALNESNNLDPREEKYRQPTASRSVPKPFEGQQDQDQARKRPPTLAYIQTCGITKSLAENVAIVLRERN